MRTKCYIMHIIVKVYKPAVILSIIVSKLANCIYNYIN